MAINKADYVNPTTGNVVASDELITDLIGGINGVVESGSNENGRWVRFADGTQICWYFATVTDQAINNAYGNLYIGSRSWNFPIPFINSQNVVGAPWFKWGTSGSWGSVNTVLASGANMRIYDNAPRAAGTETSIGFFAIGRWK